MLAEEIVKHFDNSRIAGKSDGDGSGKYGLGKNETGSYGNESYTFAAANGSYTNDANVSTLTGGGRANTWNSQNCRIPGEVANLYGDWGDNRLGYEIDGCGRRFPG